MTCASINTAFSITLALCVTSAFSIAPEPSLYGEAVIPESWPANFQSAASEDGQFVFRITDGTNPTDTPQIHSVDISTSGAFAVIDSLDIESYTTGTDGIRISGDRAYLFPNLTILDISDPSNLSVLGTAPGFGWTSENNPYSSFAIQGTTVYAVGGGRTVRIYDCADPSNIIQVGTVELTGTADARSIEVIDDNTVIIGRNWQGVTIHDTSTLGSLPVIGSLTGFQANTLSVNDSGDVVYALRRDTSEVLLTSIDISDPKNPSLLGGFDLNSFELFGSGGPIAAIGNDILAIYLEYFRVEIFDVSDPSNIQLMAPILQQSNLQQAENIARVDSDTLVLSTRSGVAVYDFTVCSPDLTGDGALDFFDISAYLTAYAGADPIADFTGDGVFDFFDVSAFLSAFNAGCP